MKIRCVKNPVNYANYANYADCAIPITLRKFLQRNLNWPLLIFKALMRVSRVDGGQERKHIRDY